MPRRRRSGPKDIRNISGNIEQMAQASALGFSDSDMKRMLEMRKKLEKLDDRQLKVYKELNKQYKEYLKAKKEIEKEDKKGILSRRQLNEELTKTKDKVKDVINPFNMLARGVGAVTGGIGSLISRITGFLNPLNLLSTAVSGIVSLYDNWFRLTNLMIGAQSAFARATGATGAQLVAFRASVSSLEGTFANLLGTANGIAEAGNFVRDTMVSLRTATELTDEAAMGFLLTTRNLSLSSDQAAGLFRSLDSGIYGTSESLEEFDRGMMDFADTIDANAATLTQEFASSRDTLALFGETAVDTFRNAATFANHFGIETSRVLALTQRYNSFNNAANSVNQLNAVFGTTISSLDLMMESDPTERMNMILSSVRGVADAASLTGPQLQALADSLGVNTDEALRMLSGDSLESIRAEARAREESEAHAAAVRERAMTDIATLINDTVERLMSWRELLQRIIDRISTALTPVFERVQRIIVAVGDGLANWVDSIANNPDFINTIEDIASYFEQMPTNINDFLPTWEEIRDTAREVWPVIRDIGSFLMTAIRFARDHSEIIGIALGALVIGNLLGGFSSLALLFSPAGALLVGIGILAAGIVTAANAASNLRSETEAIAEVAPDLRTEEERRALDTNRETSLLALRHATTSGTRTTLSTGLGGLSEIANFAAENLGGEAGREFARTSRAGFTVAGATYGEMDEHIRTALTGGASVADVTGAIMENVNAGGSDAENMIRRSLGISGALGSGLREHVESVDRSIHPDRYSDTAPAPAEVASAIDTAPSTATTVAAPPTLGSADRGETFMAQVLLDGDRVGTAIITRARRSS